MASSVSVIGICGKKFHGKDTIADYLVKHHGFVKISLGDPLKFALKHIFGFTDEQLWGKQKEVVDAYWNVTPREILQYVGTDCLRIKISSDYPHIGDNLWVMSIKRQIETMILNGITKIVVPDLRFPNEEPVIRNFNGKIIRVNRNLDSHDSHISENSIDNIHTDYIVNNNTIEQLYVDIDNIMKTI